MTKQANWHSSKGNSNPKNALAREDISASISPLVRNWHPLVCPRRWAMHLFITMTSIEVVRKTHYLLLVFMINNWALCTMSQRLPVNEIETSISVEKLTCICKSGVVAAHNIKLHTWSKTSINNKLSIFCRSETPPGRQMFTKHLSFTLGLSFLS